MRMYRSSSLLCSSSCTMHKLERSILITSLQGHVTKQHSEWQRCRDTIRRAWDCVSEICKELGRLYENICYTGTGWGTEQEAVVRASLAFCIYRRLQFTSIILLWCGIVMTMHMDFVLMAGKVIYETKQSAPSGSRHLITCFAVYKDCGGRTALLVFTRWNTLLAELERVLSWSDV